MPDPRQHVRPGQKLQIAAEQINFLNGLMRTGGGFGSGSLSGWMAGTNVLMCRNDSAEDIEQFGVLQITGVAIDPTDGERHERQFAEMPCVSGDIPSVPMPDGTQAARPQKLAITLEPIKAGKIGRVVVSGPVQVKLAVRNAEHRFARARNGEFGKLETCEESDAPAKILWKSDGGSAPWAIVALGDCGQRFFLCKSAAQWSVGSAQSVDRYDDGPLADATGGQIEAVNNLFYPIAEDSWVAIWNAPDGKWYVIAAGKTDASCHPAVIAGHDLEQVPGYDSSKTQVLGHESGCLKWIDTTECAEASAP